MSFENSWGSTELTTPLKHERLAISYDTDGYAHEMTAKDMIAMILFVPDVKQHDHSHIQLTDEAVVELQDWLTKFMKAKGLEGKKRRDFDFPEG
jgi:hypothetical protein